MEKIKDPSAFVCDCSYPSKKRKGSYIGKRFGKVVLPEVKERGEYLCLSPLEKERFFLVRERIKIKFLYSGENTPEWLRKSFGDEFPKAIKLRKGVLEFPAEFKAVAGYPDFFFLFEEEGVLVVDQDGEGGRGDFPRRTIYSTGESNLSREDIILRSGGPPPM